VAIESVLAKVEEAEERLRQLAFVSGAAPGAPSGPVQESLLPAGPRSAASPAPAPRMPASPPAKLPASGAAPAAQGLDVGWRRVVDDVRGQKATLGAVLEHSTAVALAEGTLTVALVGNHFHKDLVADRANHELVTQAVQRHISGATRIEVRVGAAPAPGAQGHPAVQAALSVFEGEVVAVRARTEEGGEGQ
jgi:hypothetical protein